MCKHYLYLMNDSYLQNRLYSVQSANIDVAQNQPLCRTRKRMGFFDRQFHRNEWKNLHQVLLNWHQMALICYYHYQNKGQPHLYPNHHPNYLLLQDR